MPHGAQLIELLAARGRQAAYEDGQLLLAARELAYSSIHDSRPRAGHGHMDRNRLTSRPKGHVTVSVLPCGQSW
jgi:hypothetical protein